MTEDGKTTAGDGTALDEELIPSLVLVGIILFIVPEPFTTTLGLVLIGLGVGLLLWDLLRQ